jgi:hypothetical protein
MEGCRVRHGVAQRRHWACNVRCKVSQAVSFPRHAAWGHSVPVVSGAQWWGGGWSGVCGREWYVWHGNSAGPIAVQSARLR